jgi:carbamoyltransferase
MLMIVLGYSGLDGSVGYARRDPDLRAGEERMVQGFDSAAALLVDGRIVAAAAEERFSLEKHTNAFPRRSIRYCLAAAGITADRLDGVAHGFDYAQYADFFRNFDAAYYMSVLAPERQIELWKEHFGLALTSRRFKSVDHHLAHAASAYYQSGFDEALCLVADGMGEVSSLTLYSVRNGGFEKLESFPIQSSVGILYSLITVHLGFKFNADEYKVMGLAPYGDPASFRSFFAGITEFSGNGKYAIRLDRLSKERSANYRGARKHLEDKIIPAGEPDGPLPQAHRDFAAAAQECLEKILFHVLEHWRRKTGVAKLCMAGGVALNCTFNGKLLQRGLFEEVYVQPAAGDDGTALGAACVLAGQNGDSLAAANVGEMPFYGPAYSKAEIRAAIERFAGQVEFADLGSEAAAAEDAARALAADEVVAWFQGRMEYGPRALGNRSILANPLSPDIKERLNSIVKLREGFRPFAPAATADRAADYFDYRPSSLFDYMLAICTVRREWRERLPGVTHVDGSARLQTVGSRKNPLFHQLISCFGELSGVHCVVNTSFNVRGQPMIVSPEIAIETFLKVKIDRLHLETFRITKRDVR